MLVKKLFSLLVSSLVVLAFAFTPAHAQFSPGSGGGGTFSGPFPGNPIDPTISYGAGIGIGNTTGSISMGTNSVTVGSPTGAAVGGGIMLTDSLAGGTVMLAGCINSVSGSVLTIVVCGTTTPVNAAATLTTIPVYRDDTYALNQAAALAVSTLRPIRAQARTYFLSSAMSFPVIPQFQSVTMCGAGNQATVFANFGRTNNTIETAGGAMTLCDFEVFNFGTPTAGYGIFIGDSTCPANNIIDFHLARVNINRTYNGLYVGTAYSGGTFKNMDISAIAGPYGVHYNVPNPCGGNSFVDVEVNGFLAAQGDFYVENADVLFLVRVGLNGLSRLYFGHDIDRTQIVSPTFEGGTGGTVACAIDFATSGNMVQVTVTGGEIAGYSQAFCNTQNNLGGSAANVIGYNNGTSCTGGKCGGGTGILNFQWPGPVITGCTSNGTPTNGNALVDSVVMTCGASSTMVMTFNTNSNGVPNTGQRCSLFHANGTLIPQTGTSVVNTNPPSYSTATFANMSTSSNEVLTYSCGQY